MAVTILGYLETAYLSEAPYAGGVSIDSRGAQFEVVNTKNKLLGAQFTGINTINDRLGNQFFAVINKNKIRSAQFKALSTGSDVTGLQFTGKILKNKNLGSQFFGKIDKNKSLGVQFLGKASKNKNQGSQFSGQNAAGIDRPGFQIAWTPIDAYNAGGYLTEFSYATTEYLKDIIEKYAGSQFTVKNNKQESLGLQFEGIITKSKTTGTQFFGKITKNKNISSQFTAVQEARLGAQFRAVIYNTSQLRFLSDFASRGTSGTNWTASSTASSASNAFSVNNLNTDIVEQVWRSGPGGSQTLTCDTESGASGVFVDTFAILNHNLTQGATILLQASNDNFATTPFNENIIVEPEHSYWISPALPITAYRYWRINIVDTSNPDNFIQIGTIVFGSATIFNTLENFNDDVRFGLKQFEDRVYTEGFTNVSNDRGQKKFLELNFTDLRSKDSNFKNLRELFKTHGSLLKVLYVPIPTEPSVFAVFSKLEKLPEESHKQMGERYVSLTLNMDESL